MSAQRPPSSPVPGSAERPDTGEMRYSAQAVEDTMRNGQGDDAAAYLREAADWIDAHPAPAASPVDGEGRPDQRLHDALAALLTEAVRVNDRLCTTPAPDAVPGERPEPGSLVLDPEDRFHLWAKLYGIREETRGYAGSGTCDGDRLDHIHEEATTALAYLDAADLGAGE